ncbi:UNVERIFIED_CONTAM: Polyadenylate-binding protein 2 [Sesamum radiatum]|uniref:Polyadenylate-binding protein n=1 Tax=Sesamum radiatum TaxID=300843 RepID=A0AAW2S5M9_SESRA
MATGSNAAAQTAAQSVTALYIGDLDASVTEEELSRLFGQVGDVVSVKICTNPTTERPLEYGYVNYSNPEDAAKAIEDLNFTPLNGKCIRISYSNRDASVRKSGAGNIFVKNLDKEVDHKALYNLFSPYGNIISSKVETDASGQSKGYGFVHYDNEEAARSAIQHRNGAVLFGKELYVGPFINKQDREMSDKTKFTNVFVKNLSELTNEEDLKKRFGEFGSITSVAVMRDEYGNSKCFGFVNFENAEDAAKSVEVLNGQIVNGKEWYVARAQKKYERERELKLRQEQIAREAHEKSLGLNNLYIKNLDDTIDNDKLKELFSPFGTVTSCKVMCDPKGLSKGSGFVAFSTSQEASKAISEMNGKMVCSKPLYVAIAEKKEVRRARLQAIFSNVRPNTVVPAVTPHMPIYPLGGPGIGQQLPYGRAPHAILPPVPGFGYQQQFVPSVRPSGTVMPNVLFPIIQHGQQSPRHSGRRPGSDALHLQQTQPPIPLMHHQMVLRGNAYHLPFGYGLSNVSGQGSSTTGMISVAPENSYLPLHERRSHGSVPVGTLASALANALPSEQRTMLGESLYPLVEQLEHEMAAKVTGMLLEMDQTEVLHLLESPESLRAKVEEAMEVLKNAPQRQASSTANQLASLVLSE